MKAGAPAQAVLLAALTIGCGARSELWQDPSLREPADAGADASPEAGACSLDPDVPVVLRGRVRDFLMAHPDFEAAIADDRGIVADTLGPDGLPVYAGGSGTATTSGKASFDQWYRDVPGVNLGQALDLPLDQAGDTAGFIDDTFFPIDGALLGNEGLDHNFHFTLESHTTFRFSGNEVFSFEGDDDLFVFINGRLALDLGGIHATEAALLPLSTAAPSLGLVAGEVYALDVFFAERHTTGSTYLLALRGFDLCR